MIEVFQYSEFVDLLGIGIGFVASQPSGKIDGKLLVSDHDFQRRFFPGDQSGYRFLLLLLDSPD
jgi:hypothetical protein